MCEQFPSLTPISIREQDAEEVIIMFARFLTLARRRNAEGESNRDTRTGIGTRQAIGRSGQRYIIHKYEDASGLTFGG